MRIEYLKNFIKLSQYKNFSKLSEELSISQSTLSHRISQMEEELGNIILIERTTKKFKLTQQGLLLLDYAEKIINLYDQCQQELLKQKDNIIDIIIITISKLPGSHILPKYITEFKEKNPRIKFDLLINNSQKSLSILKNDKADFAGVGSFMNYKMEEFDSIKIGDDIMFFICAPNHELLKNRNNTIKFQELKTYPFISREIGSGTRNIFEAQFPKHNELNIKLEIDDNNSIISAVSESDYISILSELIAKKAEDAGLIKIIKLQDIPIIAKREIYFIKPKNKKITNEKMKFWDYLEENL